MAEVTQGWEYQRTAVEYLRKLMVEHYGLNVDNPESIDDLWKEGLTPPLCEYYIKELNDRPKQTAS